VRRAVARAARGVVDSLGEPHALELFLDEGEELVPIDDVTMDEVYI